MAAGFGECCGIKMAINNVAQEKPAEKKDFSGQKGPHAMGGGLFLLFEVIELLGQR